VSSLLDATATALFRIGVPDADVARTSVPSDPRS
jgi:hypothetical protein